MFSIYLFNYCLSLKLMLITSSSAPLPLSKKCAFNTLLYYTLLDTLIFLLLWCVIERLTDFVIYLQMLLHPEYE